MAYQRVTLSQLQAMLVERLGENSVFWSEEELTNALNEALAVWHSLVGEWTDECPIAATGVNFYQTPHQLVSINRVLFNGKALHQTSLFELDKAFPGWRGVTGTTAYYWAPDGLDWFCIYPAATSGALLVEGYADSFKLHNTDTRVDLGDEELLRILEYAQWYLSFKEGVQEAVENTGPLQQHMMEAAALRNSRLRASSWYREFMGKSAEELVRGTRYPVRKLGVRIADSGGSDA